MGNPAAPVTKYMGSKSTKSAKIRPGFSSSAKAAIQRATPKCGHSSKGKSK